MTRRSRREASHDRDRAPADAATARGGSRRSAARLAMQGMWMVVTVVVGAAVLFLGLFPTRQYLDQRQSIDELRSEVDATEASVAELEARITTLADPATVERLARERFGVVRPGEEAYRVYFIQPDGAGDDTAPGPSR